MLDQQGFLPLRADKGSQIRRVRECLKGRETENEGPGLCSIVFLSRVEPGRGARPQTEWPFDRGRQTRLRQLHRVFLHPSKEQEKNGPWGPKSDTEIGKSEVANSSDYVG